MNIIDTIDAIVNNNNLLSADLKYCFVDKNKLPYKSDNSCARVNNINDFVTLDKLINTSISIMKYAGIGISIQASNICAIDVDHCFSKSFDISTANEIAKDILNIFQKFAYCEFSFSGTGLRILFKQKLSVNYNDYYIKNEATHIEFYQPNNQSYRYVTLTGQTIYNNKINNNIDFTNIIIEFLNKYMKRPKVIKKRVINIDDNSSLDELKNKIKFHYLKNFFFQDVWFSKAPGSGKDESERDYFILSYLYENITQNKEKLKLLFESSPYFKSKDYKHIMKWKQQDFRYFNYVFSRINQKK